MIRFSCQNCKRKYVLPDALARLPLLCKGCGSRLSVPGPGETAAPPRKKPEPAPEPAEDEPAAPGSDEDDLFPPEDEGDEDNSNEDEPDSDGGEESDGDEGEESDGGEGEDEDEEPPPEDDDEPPIHLPDDPPVNGEKPRGVAGAVPPAPATKPSLAPAPLPEGRRAIALAVDIAVGLALVGVGALLGEFAVRKSTAAILREAGTAPKFPPVDLLVWLACVAFPLLVMVLFANRGKTVGNWLRRRTG